MSHKRLPRRRGLASNLLSGIGIHTSLVRPRSRLPGVSHKRPTSSLRASLEVEPPFHGIERHLLKADTYFHPLESVRTIWLLNHFYQQGLACTCFILRVTMQLCLVSLLSLSLFGHWELLCPSVSPPILLFSNHFLPFRVHELLRLIPCFPCPARVSHSSKEPCSIWIIVTSENLQSGFFGKGSVFSMLSTDWPRGPMAAPKKH